MQPPTATDLIGQLLLAAPGHRRVLAGAENAKQSVDLGDPVPGPVVNLFAVQIFLIRVAGRIFDRLNAIAPVAAAAESE